MVLRVRDVPLVAVRPGARERRTQPLARALAGLLGLALVATACGGAVGSSPRRSGDAAPAERATASAPLTTTLTDVRTGERFTLGGFSGKVTFFIAMAVW